MLRFVREAPASWLSDVQNHLERASKPCTMYDHSTRATRPLPGCVVWTCAL